MPAKAITWVGQHLENGRYLIRAVLGAGGMGEVYWGHDTKLDIDVVIKVPHRQLLENPKAAARFRREIRGLLKLSHPHIVKVHDLGEHDGLPFMVMQFLGGGSLHDQLRRTGKGRGVPMEPALLHRWLPAVAGALDFIHQRGYVHRDIKPHNILFDAAGQAYVADLGLIKALAGDDQSENMYALTSPGQVVGTLYYLAPEQCQGQTCTGAADQYALAITIYEWLCGQPPFGGPMAIVLALHVSQPPPPLQRWVPDLPEALSEAVLRGLAKEPDQRYPDCTTFAQEVLAAVPGGSPLTHVSQRPSPASKATVKLPEQPRKNPTTDRIDTRATIQTTPDPVPPVPQVRQRTSKFTWAVLAVVLVAAAGWYFFPTPPVVPSGEISKAVETHPVVVTSARTTPLPVTTAQKPPVTASKPPVTVKKGNDDETLRRFAALEIQKKIPGLGPKTDWGKLLEECRQAEPTGWVLACKAECLVEAAQGKPAAPQLKEAQEAVADKAVETIGSYGHYARALVDFASGKPDMVVHELSEALRRESKDLPVLSGRRVRGTGIVLENLRGLRVPTDPAQPLQAPFRVPGDADRVASWADLALQIIGNDDPSMGTELKLCRALAGWYRPDPRAAALADELSRDPGLDKLGPDVAPLLLAQARSQGPGSDDGKRIALNAYAQFVERASRAVEAASDSAVAVACYRTVLEPAVQIGAGPAGSGPGGPARVAKLHAAIGRLIAAQPQAAWPFPEPRRRAWDAWQEAVRLDGNRAEYRVGRGYAQMLLPDGILEAVEADAQKALELDKDLPAAHGLHGHALVLRARREPVSAQRTAPLRKAIQAYDHAIRLHQDRKGAGPDLADFLAGRSTAQVELANYLPPSTDLKEYATLLRGAKEDAETACKIEDRRLPDYAWVALGHALEDIAWLLKKPDDYPGAVRAFTQAINFRGDLATYWLARGRCQYRQVVFGNDDKKILVLAANDLEEALKHGPRPDEKTEATYWLAKVLVARGEMKTAEKHFELAAKAGSSPSWPVYALDWAGLALNEAGRQADVKERARYLDFARAHAEDILKQDASPEASRILGQTFYLKGDPKKALDAYLAGLPLKDVAKADRSYLGLLLARIDCVLVNALNEEFIKMLKPSPAETARRDAVRAVELAKDPSIPDATRGYVFGQSGLAHNLAANEASVDPGKRKEFRQVLVDDLTQALKLAPSYPKAWLWQVTLGTEYMNRSQFKEALPLLEEARKRADTQFHAILDSRIRACKEKLGR